MLKYRQSCLAIGQEVDSNHPAFEILKSLAKEDKRAPIKGKTRKGLPPPLFTRRHELYSPVMCQFAVLVDLWSKRKCNHHHHFENIQQAKDGGAPRRQVAKKRSRYRRDEKVPQGDRKFHHGHDAPKGRGMALADLDPKLRKFSGPKLSFVRNGRVDEISTLAGKVVQQFRIGALENIAAILDRQC
ncbi:hypothetical protein BC828DRAFT_270955 [Blastocladiella britannica]|nr:hypothetical protein BC828DRAFT_270955 [Blastocladiella britannica]